MEIDKNFNLVFAVESEAGEQLIVIAAPVDYFVYKSHIKTLALLHKELIDSSLEEVMPTIAYEIFAALFADKKEGLTDNAKSLIREILRNCSVIEGGKKVLFETLEYNKTLSEWVISDIKSRLLFFTLEWCLSPRFNIRQILTYKMWTYTR